MVQHNVFGERELPEEGGSAMLRFMSLTDGTKAGASAAYVGDTYDLVLPIDAKRALAEGDTVMVNVQIMARDGEPGLATMNLFRLENGNVVEHWEIAHPVPMTRRAGSFNPVACGPAIAGPRSRGPVRAGCRLVVSDV